MSKVYVVQEWWDTQDLDDEIWVHAYKDLDKAKAEVQKAYEERGDEHDLKDEEYEWNDNDRGGAGFAAQGYRHHGWVIVEVEVK